MRNINTVFYLYMLFMTNYRFENNKQHHNYPIACSGVVSSLIRPLKGRDNCSSVNLAGESALKLHISIF